MKRLLWAVLILCVMFFMSGCSAKEAIASDKQEYIVSSLGFDGKEDGIKMIIEAIVVNTDDLEEEKESRLIIGEGKNINEAYGKIISKTTQPLSLGHNAITVIGEKVTPKQLDEIFEFCRENTQINIATMLIYSENAEKLLSAKAVSSVAVGYDIMSMIEVSEEKQGTIFKNRLYEALALNSKPMETFCVPYITVENEEMILNGVAVYKENKVTKLLDNEQGVILSLVTDSLKRGETVIGGQKTETQYCKVTYDFSFEEKLIININIRLKAKGDKTLIKNKTEELLGEDIFGMGNIIYQKKPKIWDKIKNSYDEYYENGEIRVNIYE